MGSRTRSLEGGPPAGSGRLADGAETAQARKKLIGAGDIAGDLRAQFLGSAEFLLFAKALPKSHFYPFRRRSQLSVEQVRFDAERRAVKRWAHADIRHGAVAARLSFEARARDVDAPSRK